MGLTEDVKAILGAGFALLVVLLLTWFFLMSAEERDQLMADLQRFVVGLVILAILVVLSGYFLKKWWEGR